MRPVTIKLEGFLSYRDPVEIDLSDLGAAALLGENGAGKTTIVEAIGWALFGRGRGRSPDDYVNPERTFARVEVTFELRDEVYRVFRERSVGTSAKSYLGLFHDVGAGGEADGLGRWEPVGGDKIAETELAIERLLGMSFETWEATSLIAQGRADAFTRLRPAERKALLGEVLELGRYGELLEAVKRGLEVELRELLELEAGMTSLGETAARGEELAAAVLAWRPRAESLAERAGFAEEDAQGARAEAQGAQERARAAGEAKRRGIELRRRVEALKAEKDGIDKALPKLEELAGRRGDLGGALGVWATSADTLISRASEARNEVSRLEVAAMARRGEIEAAMTKRRELERRRSILAGAEGVCYACGQEVDEELRDALIAAIDRDFVELSDEVARVDKGLEALVEERRRAGAEGEALAEQAVAATNEAQRLRNELAEAEHAAERIVELEERSKKLAIDFAFLSEEIARADEEAVEVGDGAELEAIARRLVDVAADARRAANEAQRELGRLEGELDLAVAAAKEIVRLEPEAEERRRAVRLLEELELAFGRNGIPALLIETAIPELSAGANELLGSLSAGRLSVRLDTLAAKKSGGVRETLDVIVGDDVSERPLEALSGGERQMVDLSLRIALSRLLAARAGTRIETLIVDEGFTALDGAGRQRTIEALHGLADVFPTLLVVTHLPELAEAFDARIIVERAGGTSTVRREG